MYDGLSKYNISKVDTPKRQRDAVLSRHKENLRELDAAETQRLTRAQQDHLNEAVRKFRRRRLIIFHDLEQDLLREVQLFDSDVRWAKDAT